MNTLARTLAAEALKLPRSWMLLVGLLAPVTQAGFLFVVFWFSEDRVRAIASGFQTWYLVNHAAWNSFFLPAAAALVASLAWSLERDSAAWKHLLGQPVPRSLHYAAKLSNALLLLLAGQLLLALMLVLAGLVLRRGVPMLEMGALEPLRLLRYTLLSSLASLPLAAAHVWLASRTPRHSVALLAALAGMWIASRLPADAGWTCLWPWGLAGRVADLAHAWAGMPWTSLLALPVTLLLAGLGVLDFARRREMRS